MVDYIRVKDPSPNRGVMIVLSYLWPLALVPFLVEKEDADIQWHAKHGIVLMIAEILILVAEILILIPFGMVTRIVSLATFGFGCVLSVFLCIALLAVHVFAIITGLNGKRFLIPGVSEYADRF